ncbi:MAG: hypothetical protein V1685_07255 [Parcubacteria group bacterium]
MKKMYVIASLAALLIIFPKVAYGDMGPKPSASYDFTYETIERPTIVDAQLIQCADSLCQESYTLQNVGPQYFRCEASSCSSLAYSYDNYSKLVIIFSDGKTRESNVFENSQSLSARYSIIVTNDSLTVAQGGLIGGAHIITGNIVTNLVTTIAIELAVACIFLLIRRIKGKALIPPLITVIAVNCISLFGLYTILTILDSGFTVLVIGEVCVFLLEATVLYLVNKKIFSFRSMLLLALMANLTSFGLGYFLL